MCEFTRQISLDDNDDTYFDLSLVNTYRVIMAKANGIQPGGKLMFSYSPEAQLRDHYGIHGDVLHWFESYLHDQKQCVAIRDSLSNEHHLQCVPQGSISGPFDFTIYAAPLEEVISDLDVNAMAYTDNTQVYLSFESMKEPQRLRRLKNASTR